MSEEEAKKNKDKFEQTAKKRIKLGLILNEFGEQNKIKVEENEIRQEIEKQLKMMPGQEKMVMEYYQKNPSATASLRGTIYEDKIIKQIKQKAKSNIKNISKEEAEKLLKSANDNMVNDNLDTTESPTKKTSTQKKAKTISKKAVKAKKVSKK
jgi:trigger factor